MSEPKIVVRDKGYRGGGRTRRMYLLMKSDLAILLQNRTCPWDRKQFARQLDLQAHITRNHVLRRGKGWWEVKEPW